ncbi:hypothetical protein WMY93_014577 [Mugilogobius chulae]|uniref:Uncharacterized protein n=1 Tax=Mugilogobius chulae TaxID=88201 RepID=A0AAW0NZL5_9GOBI
MQHRRWKGTRGTPRGWTQGAGAPARCYTHSTHSPPARTQEGRSRPRGGAGATGGRGAGARRTPAVPQAQGKAPQRERQRAPRPPPPTHTHTELSRGYGGPSEGQGGTNRHQENPQGPGGRAQEPRAVGATGAAAGQGKKHTHTPLEEVRRGAGGKGATRGSGQRRKNKSPRCRGRRKSRGGADKRGVRAAAERRGGGGRKKRNPDESQAAGDAHAHTADGGRNGNEEGEEATTHGTAGGRRREWRDGARLELNTAELSMPERGVHQSSTTLLCRSHTLLCSHIKRKRLKSLVAFAPKPGHHQANNTGHDVD